MPDLIDEATQIAASISIVWDPLIEQLRPILGEIQRTSGQDLLATVGFTSGDVFAEVARTTLADAVARAAELVGKRVLKDGTIVENPDPAFSITESTRNMMRDAIANGIEQGLSAGALRDQIVNDYAFSNRRALNIARTERSFAQNRGALTGAKASGVVKTKEWVRGSEQDCPDICEPNEQQGPIPIDDDFDSGDSTPPGHPSAVFAGYSFASYGRLHQMLRARYDGPAVTFQIQFDQQPIERSSSDASAPANFLQRDIGYKQSTQFHDLVRQDRARAIGSVRPLVVGLTIGPNHPMLTQRGFVCANDLKEGDKLLYDSRVISASPTEGNLKKMPMIEDSFETLRATFAASSASRSDANFHGDEIFIEGEIQAIRPTRDLLPKLNPSGLEILCECPLTRTYPDAIHVAGCGRCQRLFDAAFAPASSLMSGGGLSDALVSATLCPPFFKLGRIISRHYETSLKTIAFDASTEHTAYNIGGFVVKNCVCTLQFGTEEGGESEDSE